MKIIKNKLTYRSGHEVDFPACPPEFRKQAELLAEGLKHVRLDGYGNLAELDQVLAGFYAKRYGEMALPQNIRAAREWLVQQGIMELKSLEVRA